MFDDIDKVNFTNMSDVSLAKWVHKNSTLNLLQAYKVAKLLRAAYSLGEIRGKVVN